MAGGYAAIANNGKWREPTCIVSILDNKGNEVWDSNTTRQVFTEEAANYLTDVLIGVADYGTARGTSLAEGHQFACKTGTTNENRVGWFCGYTKYYTIAVYVGADSGNIPIAGLWGGTYPARIWAGMQDTLLSGKSVVNLLGATEPPTEPAEQSAEPVESAEQPTGSAEQPVESAEQPVESAEPSVESAEQPEEPAEPEESAEEPAEELAEELEELIIDQELITDSEEEDGAVDD